jgi:hypothetical protein
MKMVRLTFSGVRSYPGTCVIDFPGKTPIGILGDTGAGKTSILEAIAVALYGKCSYKSLAEKYEQADWPGGSRVPHPATAQCPHTVPASAVTADFRPLSALCPPRHGRRASVCIRPSACRYEFLRRRGSAGQGVRLRQVAHAAYALPMSGAGAESFLVFF